MADTTETAAGCALIKFSGCAETTAFHELIATTSDMPGFSLTVISGGPCLIDIAIGPEAAEVVVVDGFVVPERGRFGVVLPCSIPSDARLSCRAHTDRARDWPTDWVAISLEDVTNAD